MTDAEYQRVLAVARALAAHWMKSVIEQNNVDVLVSGMSYSGNAGAAGVPALTIPAGLDPKGRPQGVILSGPHLAEPKLFAVGYALEQALKGRVEPDLEATIQVIEPCGIHKQIRRNDVIQIEIRYQPSSALALVMLDAGETIQTESRVRGLMILE